LHHEALTKQELWHQSHSTDRRRYWWVTA